MQERLTVGAVVPARDEAGNIGAVVGELLALRTPGGEPVIDDVVVCDNGSTDGTAQRARAAGARVVVEPTPGYGRACLTALAALRPLDVVLFVDGDQSSATAEALDLLHGIAAGADLVIGSRVPGRREPGALSPPQVAGNRVASVLIRLLWGRRVTRSGSVPGYPPPTPCGDSPCATRPTAGPWRCRSRRSSLGCGSSSSR